MNSILYMRIVRYEDALDDLTVLEEEMDACISTLQPQSSEEEKDSETSESYVNEALKAADDKLEKVSLLSLSYSFCNFMRLIWCIQKFAKDIQK